MDLSSMLAGGGSAGLDLGTMFIQDEMQDRNRRETQDYNSEMFQHRYRYQVSDLKAAGLNPMLSYMQGPGSAPTSTAQAVTQPRIGEAFNAGRSTSAMVANMNADTMKKAAETRNVDQDTLVKTGMSGEVAAMTMSALASADQARAMSEQIRVSIPKIMAEIENIKSQVEKNKSDVRLNDSLIKANAFLNDLRLSQTVLEGKRSVSEQQSIDIKEPQARAYRNDEKGGRALGTTKATGDVMQNFYRIINPFADIFGGGR